MQNKMGHLDMRTDGEIYCRFPANILQHKWIMPSDDYEARGLDMNIYNSKLVFQEWDADFTVKSMQFILHLRWNTEFPTISFMWLGYTSGQSHERYDLSIVV